METSSLRPVQNRSVGQRYKQAYVVARTVNGLGAVIRMIGYLGGAVVAGGGVVLYTQTESITTARTGILAGAGIALALFLLSIFASAYGQLLKAALDSAVNTSPSQPTTKRRKSCY